MGVIQIIHLYNNFVGGYFMQYKIKDMLDVNLLDKMLNNLYQIIKIPISIVDISGEVIVHTGWTNICSSLACNCDDFHKMCLKEYWKNNTNEEQLHSKGEVSCINGLKMYRVPVYIKDTVLANVFFCKVEEENQYNGNSEKPLQEFIENYVHLISDFLTKQCKIDMLRTQLVENYEEMKVAYDQLLVTNNELKFNIWELQQKLVEDERCQKYKASGEKKSYMNTVTALGYILEDKDVYTARHQKKVAYLACKIAAKLRMDKNRLENLYIAAMLHDIGKIGIPSAILSKPDKLSDSEYDLIKSHVQISYDIVRSFNLPKPVAEIVLQHHEKIDGSGYPNGRKGNEILLEAKIISVADVIEAITAKRPYKSAMDIHFALEEIKKYSGTYYDPQVVEICTVLCNENSWEKVFEEP